MTDQEDVADTEHVRLRDRGFPAAVASWISALWRLMTDRREGSECERDRWAAVAFVAVAIPVGLTFIVLIPPSQVVDEQSHFMRVWQLSEFNLRTEVRIDPNIGLERSGSVYDDCVVEYLAENVDAATLPSDFSLRNVWFDTPDCSPQSRSFEFFDTAVLYGPWSYPGQTVGVGVGRALGLPLPVTFHLGRLAGLLVFVAAVAAALRIAPRGRLTMMAVALLPMSLMSAAAYSADGVVIAGSILAVASVLRLALDDEMQSRHRRWLLGVLAAALGVVVITKPNYIVLLGLLLLIPLQGFRSRRQGRMVLAGIAAAISSLAAFFYVALSGAPTSPIYYPETQPSAQLRTLVTNPIGFLGVVWDTVFSYTYEIFFLRGWVGIFGMFRTGRPEVAPLLAVPFVIVAFVAVSLAIAAEAGLRRPLDWRTRWWRRGVVAIVGVGGVTSVFAAAFVFWTAPGAPVIEGVQGRYIVPFVPLLAAALALRRFRSDMALGVRWIVVVAVVLAVASIDKYVALFY